MSFPFLVSMLFCVELSVRSTCSPTRSRRTGRGPWYKRWAPFLPHPICFWQTDTRVRVRERAASSPKGPRSLCRSVNPKLCDSSLECMSSLAEHLTVLLSKLGLKAQDCSVFKINIWNCSLLAEFDQFIVRRKALSKRRFRDFDLYFKAGLLENR